MLPAIVLLDEAGALLRPSIQQSDGRSAARGRRACGRGRRARLPRQRPATASTSSWSRRSCAGSSVTSRRSSRRDRHRLRLLRLHQLAADRRPRRGAELGARGRASIDLDDRRARRRPDRARRICPRSAVPPIHVAHAAARRGDRARRPRRPGCRRACRSSAAPPTTSPRRWPPGIVAPGDVLLKFGGAGDIIMAAERRAARSAALPRLSPGPRPLRAERLHGGVGLGAELARRAARARTRSEQAASARSTRSPRRSRPAATACSACPISSARRRRSRIRSPAARSPASASATAPAISGAPCSRPSPTASAITSRCSASSATRRSASSPPTAAVAEPRLDADHGRRRCRSRCACSRTPYGSCVGAAWVAAIGSGQNVGWDDVQRLSGLGGTIAPDPPRAAVYDRGYAEFRDLYETLKPLFQRRAA